MTLARFRTPRANRLVGPAARLVLMGLALLVAALSGPAVDAQSRVGPRALARETPVACPQRPSAAPGRSFRDRDLTFQNFAHQNLTNADFRGKTLKGTIFVGANLTGADFTGATIVASGQPALVTDFSFANLDSACFIGVTFQAPTYFTYASLTCTDFSGVDLSPGFGIFGDKPVSFDASRACRTTFRKATMNCELVAQWKAFDLTGAVVDSCTASALKGVDLRGAVLDNVNFYLAHLEGVQLDNARLHGANLNFANLTNASMNGAQLGVDPNTGTGIAGSLSGAEMLGVDLSNADLRSVDLSGAHIYASKTKPASLAHARLDSANLTGALLPSADLTSASLTNTNFNGAVLVSARFSGSNLSGTKFTDAYLQGADFSKAFRVSGATLGGARVSTSSSGWTYTSPDGSPYTVAFGPTALAAFAGSSDVTCPNKNSGPCDDADKLTPITDRPVPLPPQPSCVPSSDNGYECPPPKPAN